jgi:hypothetical protein
MPAVGPVNGIIHEAVWQICADCPRDFTGRRVWLGHDTDWISRELNYLISI